ncbi:V-set domain-containing T-cell activation inhibitor 1 [Liparis tanakae]|uniref:V-set domain-containing T-cell activation inhibitor 1 n=1 Tax=Liparis tanakae TaxID=230148 RepID=A0A4Z2F4B8_9TELE|nr:V-set domain-containing T-cell activation inhibitor 1 [Liparis tanakae]
MATLGQIIFCSMITLIIIFGAAIILILALSFSGQLSEVKSNDVTPIANLGDDQLLSCFENSEAKPAKFTNMAVSWEKTGLTGSVYRYSAGAPSLLDQAPQFKGRTQLFPDALLAGNASLLLRSVRPSDAGQYTCSMSSSAGSGRVKVQLQTAAYSAPAFNLKGGALVAVAPRWFPKPGVAWSDFFGTVLNGSTSFVKSSVGVFTVISTLQPITDGETYTCRIQNDLVSGVSKATVTDSSVKAKTYFTFNAASSLLTSTHLSMMSSVLCIYYLT